MCKDSNSWLLGCESASITTNPGFTIFFWAIFMYPASSLSPICVVSTHPINVLPWKPTAVGFKPTILEVSTVPIYHHLCRLTNDWPQTSHWWSLRWTFLMCNLRLDLHPKDLLQSWHIYSFGFSWTVFTCIWRLDLSPNDMSQTKHWCTFRFSRTVRMCTLRCAFCAKIWLQTSHWCFFILSQWSFCVNWELIFYQLILFGWTLIIIHFESCLLI